MAYSNCQHDFQSPFLPPSGSSVRVTDPQLIEAILKVIFLIFYFIFSFNLFYYEKNAKKQGEQKTKN
jgi:hypothetical protein